MEVRSKKVPHFHPRLAAPVGDTLAAFTNASLWLASRGFMLAFIAAAASADVETTLQKYQTITDDLSVGEVKKYKLLLDVDVRSDPTR